jgi:hypothetical protein
MGVALDALRERAQDAEREAERLRDIAVFAEKLGEDGIAELLILLGAGANGAKDTTNGNGQKPDEKVPRGREAIRLIVSERPGIWTLKQIRAELEQRGWFTSRKGLEVAASRLCADGEGKRIGRGRYTFPAENSHLIEEEVERESEASDGAMIPFET